MVSSKYASRLDAKHCISCTTTRLHASLQVNFKEILVGDSLSLFWLKTVLESMQSFHGPNMVDSIAN